MVPTNWWRRQIISCFHRYLRPENLLLTCLFDRLLMIKIVGLEMACIHQDPNHNKILLRKSLRIKTWDAEGFNHMPPEAFQEGNNGFRLSLADVRCLMSGVWSSSSVNYLQKTILLTSWILRK